MWGLSLMLLEKIGYSPTYAIASILGSTEPAIRLFLSIIMGYPIAIGYHKYIKEYHFWRHAFFILMGVDMALFNFGLSMYHNLVPALVLHLTTKLFESKKMNVIFTFVFNMAYLLIGYVVTESEDYDITWTMPHCVLTLKLIALSFDLWDGEKPSESLSENSKMSAVRTPPTLQELIGFVYFPACFLVGPIFSFRRYVNFVNDVYPIEANIEQIKTQSFFKLLQGFLYIAAHQIGIGIFSGKYMASDDFWTHGIVYRHWYCGIWGHLVLYKYIACWLLTEAACIRFGFSYNGEKRVDELSTVSRWDGCNNIKLLRFETATKFQHYIESFNCNTNHFAAEYIYKRLKFLGNRNLSQLFTLLFLAVWHGVRSGYYMTFFNEFLIMFMEKELEPMISKTHIYSALWENNITKYLLYAILKSYTIIFMGWSLVPFDLKVFSKWFGVYYSLYFSGFILLLPWAFFYKNLLKSALASIEPKVSKQENKSF